MVDDTTLTADRGERACWVLHRWDHGPGRLSVLAWGGLWAAGTALERGFDTLVLCADEHQFEDETERSTGLRLVREPYDDDGLLVARPDFQEKIFSRGRHLAEDFRAAWARGESRRMLITCAQGYNRSALLTARVYWELTGYPGFLIVAAIRKQRPQALFREAFREWIESWEVKE